MLWQRYRQRRVKWHIATQWGSAKGYCVTHRPHRPFYEGVRHNIVCGTSNLHRALAYTKMPSVMSMPCFFRWASVVTS